MREHLYFAFKIIYSIANQIYITINNTQSMCLLMMGSYLLTRRDVCDFLAGEQWLTQAQTYSSQLMKVTFKIQKVTYPTKQILLSTM